MAEGSSRRGVLYAAIAAVVVVALILFFALSPVRRPRSTINGAPPETSAPLKGGPVNGVGDNLAGNTTGDR